MLIRYLAALAIVVAGICTTIINWRFSFQLGTNVWDSYTWATFSVALDVAKWLMLPCAASAWPRYKWRAVAALCIWLIATIYSFSAAAGYAAINRDMTSSERNQQVELQKTLETMKQSPRWQSSAACADATSPPSKEFCANYRAALAQLKTPTENSDPQSALFAKLTGLEIGTVKTLLSLFLAIACEVISALGFFAILPPAPLAAPVSPVKSAKLATPQQIWQPPVVLPDRQMKWGERTSTPVTT